MQAVRCHEELLAEGLLVAYDRHLGTAIFISHQWRSRNHPDPDARQLRVLQTALQNLLSGKTSISAPIIHEIVFGSVHTPTAAELSATPLFVWYDYFSCPQDEGDKAVADRMSAINSIPSYVGRCQYFIILCPAQEDEFGQMLSGKTWAERAWCRAERVARELACSSGFPFAVESTTHVTLVNQQLGFLCPPGEGHLSFDEDRQKLATIMVQLIWNKLSHCLMQGDLHSYRLILNQQDARLKNLDTRPVDLAIPGFNPRENPDDDPEGFTLANFMHQNGFETISQRDESGWTPLCYAAMNGDTCIIAALLKRRADPNEKVTKKDPKAYVQKNTSAVSICAWFGRNEALKLLLSARAHPDALSGLKQTALEWACCGNNVEGVRLLLDARADHTIQNIMGCTPFQAGCCMGSVDTMQAMLEHAPGQILQHSLHFSLLLGEGSGQAVCMLLQSRADVNERCNFFKTKTYGWWALLKSLSLAHSAGYTSKLRKLAYHHHGATPLMFSVLAGTFEATYALLRAGARTDLRNGRGKVVLDLAREIGATDLMKALEAASLPSLASPLSAPSASWETQDPLMAESF
ncbi:unnamed protein product [Symbiodinium natans]|uniref:Uncharacterized protein n=1 Tax=Symbiodinium natans TaxID=878477 RepID=A0A812MG33_9DINO|nr:unnamed protein product [Symbiodinium natans]